MLAVSRSRMLPIYRRNLWAPERLEMYCRRSEPLFKERQFVLFLMAFRPSRGLNMGSARCSLGERLDAGIRGIRGEGDF